MYNNTALHLRFLPVSIDIVTRYIGVKVFVTPTL